MTEPSASGFSDSPGVDQVGLAARAVGAAMLFSVAWLSLIAWGTLALAGEVTSSEIDPNAAHVNLLLYGLVSGLAFTGAVGWLLLGPVASTWRRGGLTMVGVLGGLCLGMLATFLAREIGGSAALLGTAIVATIMALWLGRGARRWSA